MPLLEIMTAGPRTSLRFFDSFTVRQRRTLAAVEDRVGQIELALAQVVVLAVIAINHRGIAGHRAVEINRNRGDAAFALEDLQQIDQLLSAAHGKRGNEHHAAALCRPVDDCRQGVENRLTRVITIAVGAFAHKIVAIGWRGRVVIQRPVVAADIA